MQGEVNHEPAHYRSMTYGGRDEREAAIKCVLLRRKREAM